MDLWFVSFLVIYVHLAVSGTFSLPDLLIIKVKAVINSKYIFHIIPLGLNTSQMNGGENVQIDKFSRNCQWKCGNWFPGFKFSVTWPFWWHQSKLCTRRLCPPAARTVFGSLCGTLSRNKTLRIKMSKMISKISNFTVFSSPSLPGLVPLGWLFAPVVRSRSQ